MDSMAEKMPKNILTKKPRNRKMIEYKQSNGYNVEHCRFYPQILWLTDEITKTYAGHPKWVNDVFLKGLYAGKTRGYVFAVAPDSKQWIEVSGQKVGTLAGCSLLKNTPEEKKICCLFVNPNHRKQGIASQLIERSFVLLDTDKPLMTVAENNLDQLRALISRYGFELTSVKDSVYKPGVKEYYYNEGLAR